MRHHEGIARAKGMAKLLAEIELPLSRVLASMEMEGFQVDVQGVRQFGEMLQLEIEQLTAEIHDMAGEEFNINSPEGIGTHLFDKLQLPTGKKTKTGYSTNVDVLESCRLTIPSPMQCWNTVNSPS